MKAPDLNPPDQQLLSQYLDALWAEKGLSDNTLASCNRDLLGFAHWLTQRGRELLTATPEDVQVHLSVRLEQGLKARSTARFLPCPSGFYGYLVRENRLLEDTTVLIENPKLGRPLPQSLTEKDVEDLLAAPDLDDPLGLLDRTTQEVLYACGLRVSELVGLTL